MTPFVRPGDLWTLGRHRMLCGDATNADDVARLMDGLHANLVVTDPPYNVAYESADGKKIQNDSMADETFYAFLLAAFRNMAAHLAEGGSAYVFHADTEGLNFRRAFREAGFHISGVCVWVKNSLVLGRSPYQWQHEPVLYGWLPNGKHKWFSDRKQSTVWKFDKPRRSKDHPTMKPIPLLAYPIKNSSAPNGVVMDLFGGSGSTLMACEETDRICRTMELDPRYAIGHRGAVSASRRRRCVAHPLPAGRQGTDLRGSPQGGEAGRPAGDMRNAPSSMRVRTARFVAYSGATSWNSDHSQALSSSLIW